MPPGNGFIIIPDGSSCRVPGSLPRPVGINTVSGWGRKRLDDVVFHQRIQVRADHYDVPGSVGDRGGQRAAGVPSRFLG